MNKIIIHYTNKKKSKTFYLLSKLILLMFYFLNGGLDGDRTRDLLRDREAY